MKLIYPQGKVISKVYNSEQFISFQLDKNYHYEQDRVYYYIKGTTVKGEVIQFAQYSSKTMERNAKNIEECPEGQRVTKLFNNLLSWLREIPIAVHGYIAPFQEWDIN